MRFMQIESVFQTKNRSEPAKNRFSVALLQNSIFLLNCILLKQKWLCFTKETGILIIIITKDDLHVSQFTQEFCLNQCVSTTCLS